MVPTEMPGSLLAGKYRLERILARGRSGIVWEATHLATARVVAVKLFVEPMTDAPRARNRMLLEARISSLAAHPNLLPIDDVLELEDGRAALVMERLLGESLRARLERGPLAAASLSALFDPVLEALDGVHKAGLVHRDLKPDNLFVTRDPERLIVLDFGIAKLTGEVGLDLTSTGVSMGTPFYMAPEQLFGDDVDARADVWALGVILFEALTGRRPTEAANLGQLLKKVSARALPRLDAAAAGGHVALAQVVNRMLDVRKDQRPTLAEVRTVLTAAASTPPSARSRWPALGAALLAVAGVGAATFAFPSLRATTASAVTRRLTPAAAPAPSVSIVVESDAGLEPPALRAARRSVSALASIVPGVASSARTPPQAPPLHEIPPF